MKEVRFRQRFLITGTSSGLGKYLLEEWGGVPFMRMDMDRALSAHKDSSYDCIVHCATDARNAITSDELWRYYQSHVEFTENLAQIPHRLYVFLSSAAVYPDPFRLNAESDVIRMPDTLLLSPTHGLYGFFKLLGEEIVKNKSHSPLILRVTGLIGRTNRPNSLFKILTGCPGPIRLSGDSSFNVVSMSQVKRFIELALAQGITGVFNLGATDNVPLRRIADAVLSPAVFGPYTHNVQVIDTAKVRSVSTDFERGSIEVALEAAQELRGAL
jgi:dTDP-4-dehydrorhamnose reductase